MLTVDIPSLSVKIAGHICDDIYRALVDGKTPSGDGKIVIFTAGAPASGKSEFVTNFLKEFGNLVLIDADSFRPLFPYYNGDNAEQYQTACTQVVKHCFRQALKDGYNIILDSNFAYESVAMDNVRRALNADYHVQIVYIYLDPLNAWYHVQSRTRKIPPEVFCRNYTECRSTISAVMNHGKFQGKKLSVKAIINTEDPPVGSSVFSGREVIGIKADNLDEKVPFPYSSSDLNKIAV